jgi:hypothetical protein
MKHTKAQVAEVAQDVTLAQKHQGFKASKLRGKRVHYSVAAFQV